MQNTNLNTCILFQVRSLTLDVRVWEPSVINLFQSLGNRFVNKIWEEMLPSPNSGHAEDNLRYYYVCFESLYEVLQCLLYCFPANKLATLFLLQC